MTQKRNNIRKSGNRPAVRPMQAKDEGDAAAKRRGKSPLWTRQGTAMKPAAIVLLPIILFAIWAFYMLVGRNSDYMYTVSEHSLFLLDSSFYDMMVVKPGGFITWLGCFFTQSFHVPVVGAILLILIWTNIYAVTIKAFRLRGAWCCAALLPISALLWSETSIGYWLYYMKIPGYWFAPSLALLLCVLAVWIHIIIYKRNQWAALAWMVAWSLTGYVATGWCGLLATVLMSIASRRKGLTFAIAALCIAAIPVVSYQYCTQMQIEDAWHVGFPVFQIDKYLSWYPMIPFILLPLMLLALGILARLGITEGTDTARRRLTVLAATALTVAVTVAGSLTYDFDDSNYHAELRMYRAADEGRWSDVLQTAYDAPGLPTREMVMLKNLALTYRGNIGDYMFHYENMSTPPYTYDSLAVRMAQTNASLVYYYYARLNFATRWCIENGVELGFTPDKYKILTRCALISGEIDLARKYINILKKTIYHREWAEQYEPMLADTTLIASSPEFQNQLEYYRHFRSMLDSDEGLCEMYLLQYFSQTMNKDSKLLQETTLVFALQSKDIQLFWPRFFLYAHLHPGEQMPIHYQEAAYLYGHLEHEVDISGMPFDEMKIKQRYASFNQMSTKLIQEGKSIEEVGDIMKPMYGDTFWWFYFFCRGVNSY